MNLNTLYTILYLEKPDGLVNKILYYTIQSMSLNKHFCHQIRILENVDIEISS